MYEWMYVRICSSALTSEPIDRATVDQRWEHSQACAERLSDGTKTERQID